MKKILVSCVLAVALTACTNTKKTDATDQTESTETVTTTETTTTREVIRSRAIGTQGASMEMSFDNAKNQATLVFNNETIVLDGQKAASGIWYKNDHYELRGKGQELELTKDGKTVFQSKKSVMYGEQPLFIAAQTEPCTAGVQKKDCMKVKFDKEAADWELFYNTIEGFTYEPGNEYELVVKAEKVDNPPADASDIKYTLVKEVSKTKK